MSDTDFAVRVLSNRLENLCKGQSQLTTVAALAAVVVLAENRATDPADMVPKLEAIIEMHRSVVGSARETQRIRACTVVWR